MPSIRVIVPDFAPRGPSATHTDHRCYHRDQRCAYATFNAADFAGVGPSYEDASCVYRRSCAPFVARPDTIGLERQTLGQDGSLRPRTYEGRNRSFDVPASRRLHEAQYPTSSGDDRRPVGVGTCRMNSCATSRLDVRHPRLGQGRYPVTTG